MELNSFDPVTCKKYTSNIIIKLESLKSSNNRIGPKIYYIVNNQSVGNSKILPVKCYLHGCFGIFVFDLLLASSLWFCVFHATFYMTRRVVNFVTQYTLWKLHQILGGLECNVTTVPVVCDFYSQ